jgi:hypothetical protein
MFAPCGDDQTICDCCDCIDTKADLHEEEQKQLEEGSGLGRDYAAAARHVRLRSQ